MSYQNILSSKEKAQRSVSFGYEMAERPHSVPREVRDLRGDTELAFERLEGGVNIPVITSVPNGQGFVHNGDATLTSLIGLNFLANRTQASLVLGDLTITSILPGEAGNNISVEVAAHAGALAVSLAGQKITISPAAAGNTWAQVKTALEADASIDALISITNDGEGNSTAGAVAAQNLSGGTGDGLIVRMYGNTANGNLMYENLTVSACSDTSITLAASTTAKDHISAAGVIVTVVVISHHVQSNFIQYIICIYSLCLLTLRTCTSAT